MVEIFSSNEFNKEISQIVSYDVTNFLVHDEGTNLTAYVYSSQFFIYHTFTPQKLEFFNNKQIVYIDVCQMTETFKDKQIK